MDISSIPRSFWHAVSASLLIVTVGLTVATYKSRSLSIEIANARITVSNAAGETDQIRQELEQKSRELEEKARELNELNAALEQKVEDLRNQLAEASAPEATAVLEPAKFTLPDDAKNRLERLSIREDAFRGYDERLEDVRQSLISQQAVPVQRSRRY